MYKSMEPKAVKPSDPWAFCRNKACPVYGLDQTKTTVLQALGVENEEQAAKKVAKLKAKQPSAKQIKAAKKSIAARDKIPPFGKDRRSKKPDKPPERFKEEPEEVKAARERIGKAIAINGKHSKAVVGLTLTICAQALGNHDVANRLIDEYKLTEQFGIEKRRA